MDACVHMVFGGSWLCFETIYHIRRARTPALSSAGLGWSSGPTQFAPPPRRGRSGGRELTALRTIPFAGLPAPHLLRDKNSFPSFLPRCPAAPLPRCPAAPLPRCPSPP